MGLLYHTMLYRNQIRKVSLGLIAYSNGVPGVTNDVGDRNVSYAVLEILSVNTAIAQKNGSQKSSLPLGLGIKINLLHVSMRA